MGFVLWTVCGLSTIWMWGKAGEPLKPLEAFLAGVLGPVGLAFTVSAAALSWHKRRTSLEYAPRIGLSEPDISYDPLDEEFKELEAKVADREQREAIADAVARDYRSIKSVFDGWQEGVAIRQQHEMMKLQQQHMAWQLQNRYQNQYQAEMANAYRDYRNELGLGNLTACELAQGSLSSQKVNGQHFED